MANSHIRQNVMCNIYPNRCIFLTREPARVAGWRSPRREENPDYKKMWRSLSGPLMISCNRYTCEFVFQEKLGHQQVDSRFGILVGIIRLQRKTIRGATYPRGRTNGTVRELPQTDKGSGMLRRPTQSSVYPQRLFQCLFY